MATAQNQAPNVDLFDAYFRRADLDRDGRISGSEAVTFLQATNLPREVLAQVCLCLNLIRWWCVCNRVYLWVCSCLWVELLIYGWDGEIWWLVRGCGYFEFLNFVYLLGLIFATIYVARM